MGDMHGAVSFKHMDASEALTSDVLAKIARLERVAPEMTRCRVVIEAPHHKKLHGRTYRVVIRAQLRAEELVVGKAAELPAHEDPYVAVRDAFAAMRRRLEAARAH